MSTLPNLSNLCNVEKTLFPHLITKGNSKQPGCTFHKEPIKADEDNDYRTNCALEGYLMYKKLDPSDYDEPKVPIQYSKNFTIKETFEGEDIDMEFISFGGKGTAWNVKDEKFREREKDWIDNTFEKVCKRPGELGTIVYENYAQGLMTKSDWYYLDKKNKYGHIFISIVDSTQRRRNLHIPDEGVFKNEKFLYISLVCGIKDFGKTMVDGAAKKIAASLGLDGILLSALSNSAGAYFRWGYQFVSRLDGQYIDVSPFVRIATNKKGEQKPFLFSDIDYVEDQPARNDKRKANEEPNQEDLPNRPQAPTPTSPEDQQGRLSMIRELFKTLLDAMAPSLLSSTCG